MSSSHKQQSKSSSWRQPQPICPCGDLLQDCANFQCYQVDCHGKKRTEYVTASHSVAQAAPKATTTLPTGPFEPADLARFMASPEFTFAFNSFFSK